MFAGLGFRPAVGVMALSENRAVQVTQPKNPTSVNIDLREEGGLSACKFLRNLLFRLSKERGILFIRSGLLAIQ
jgi:hypothetical protein